MFLWMILSVVGLFIGNRISNVFLKMRLFSEKKHRFLSIAIIMVMIFLNLVGRNSLIFQSISLCILVFLPLLVLQVAVAVRRSRLDLEFVSILDSLIIRMRSGMALKSAISEEISFLPLWLQPIWQNYFSRSEFQSETSNLPELIFLTKICDIERKKVKQIEKLKALRDRYQLKFEFRQKSRQALMQNRIQSLVLSIMYILVVLFHYLRSHERPPAVLFLFATAAFAFGTAWLWRLGRTYKWKI